MSDCVRLHMPGHKGAGPLGIEALDITEIDGAASLYDTAGIIADSEAVASGLFGAQTCYSAEGSSLAIRAMLALALSQKPSPSGEGGPQGDVPSGTSVCPADRLPHSIPKIECGTTAGPEEVVPRPLVLAARNAHRAFVSAAALLDFDVVWLPPHDGDAYHGGAVSPDDVDAALARLGGRCHAVYLTSPDYLGHMTDIAAVADICHRRSALLLVDNAHGAYLKFLRPSRHPMDLGADLCCDSAHKTLPALTGAAYLHVHPRLGIAPSRVKEALALFGSSSPSWLILQSLDACNPVLAALPDTLSMFLPKLRALQGALVDDGWTCVGDEPMKLTLTPKSRGWTGDALADVLREQGVFCEFHDPDFITFMPSPWNALGDLQRLSDALLAIPRRDPLPDTSPPPRVPEAAMSIRAATFAPRQTLPVEHCEGRVLAAPAICCPPCVPVAVCGEVIDANVIAALRYYGIDACEVVAQ